jgi:predicted DNA-binding protein YlxM (UPF0122 family)
MHIITIENNVFTIVTSKIYKTPAKEFVNDHQVRCVQVLEQYEENIHLISKIEIKILFLNENVIEMRKNKLF